jgi:hypothetical protein
MKKQPASMNDLDNRVFGVSDPKVALGANRLTEESHEN